MGKTKKELRKMNDSLDEMKMMLEMLTQEHFRMDNEDLRTDNKPAEECTCDSLTIFGGSFLGQITFLKKENSTGDQHLHIEVIEKGMVYFEIIVSEKEVADIKKYLQAIIPYIESKESPNVSDVKIKDASHVISFEYWGNTSNIIKIFFGEILNYHWCEMTISDAKNLLSLVSSLK